MTTEFQDIRINKISRTIGFAELVADGGAALTHTIDIGTLPQAAKVSACYLSITEAVTGASVTDFNVVVGETAVDTDRYLADVDIFEVAAGVQQNGTPGAALAVGNIELTSTVVTVLMTTIGENMDDLTAGEFTVVIHYVEGDIR